jgi:hypothetical protein
MTITLNVPNEQLFEKILWFLNHFKSDGLEIITNQDNNPKSEKLKQFEEIISTKSKNSIKIEESVVLNPHKELSNDIS